MLNRTRNEKGPACRQAGFTLIELLIVIVIIGILSGVLIAVINPVRQQNRSRNAAIQAAMNKASFAISTARAGIGRLPSNDELDDELENISHTCTGADLDCNFDMSGTNLPNTCGADGYSGTGNTPCQFHVEAYDTESNQFIIVAKKYTLNSGDDEELYVFSAEDGFYECPHDASIGAAVDGSSTTGLPDTCNVVGDAPSGGGTTNE